MIACSIVEATKSISESKKDWEAAKAAKVALARRNSSSKTKISRRHRGEAVAAAKYVIPSMLTVSPHHDRRNILTPPV